MENYTVAGFKSNLAYEITKFLKMRSHKNCIKLTLTLPNKCQSDFKIKTNVKSDFKIKINLHFY